MKDHAFLMVTNEDCETLNELIYDERGRELTKIQEAEDMGIKRLHRYREKRLAKLHRRVRSCQEYLAKEEAEEH